ncbi:hypothetical protein B1A99_22105 [Cohnella sp. CIP 111063]|uniref:hypothetical protein n=1 Tax=unclassified Cohnella TaxID=2636738 RepID=UPI000B8C33A4|nr:MULTISPECIES: hypothetical protein [unclassified Cohnella]OXS55921.1 hypothetical protein B1A99_22105 [Cohnella sp. CIP 111063]PRX67125.1 hypothetical protein B0G52_115135 [Cohnella sp. SGD-V74]
MNILLLCNYDPYNAAMVSDHINAFYNFSMHNIFVYTNMVKNGGNLDEELELDQFDAVIVHYSIFLSGDAYASQKTRYRLKKYKGIKAVFIQDEYRSIQRTIDSLNQIEADILFTCVPEKHIEDVYPTNLLPKLKKIQVLTGYINEDLLIYPPRRLSKRKFDISYRGRKYPAWHGRMGREKWIIGERFNDEAKKYGLRTNISSDENDRLYGSQWIELIRNSKAVLGVESGASIFDFTGEVSARVETYVALTKKAVKKNEEHHYEQLKKKFFENIEDVYDLSQISPRVLEAISLRTACVLYKGDYSGLLTPWRHYIPLEKDHSNMDQVIACLKDDERLAEIIANAYAEVALNPSNSYKSFIKNFDEIIEEHFFHNMEFVKDNYVESEVTKGITEVSAALQTHRNSEPDPKEFNKKFPFFYVKNPHAFLIPKRYSLIRILWSKLPYKIKMRLKKVVFK